MPPILELEIFDVGGEWILWDHSHTPLITNTSSSLLTMHPNRSKVTNELWQRSGAVLKEKTSLLIFVLGLLLLVVDLTSTTKCLERC